MPREFAKPVSGSLPTIINHFKGAVTRRMRSFPDGYDGGLWQRNYYERVIRNGAELEQIQAYIRDNPRNWDRDEENR